MQCKLLKQRKILQAGKHVSSSLLSSNLKEKQILRTEHIKSILGEKKSLVLSFFFSSFSMHTSQGAESAIILTWTEVNENLPK